jgi:potassium-transporting ATPase potassium-binding subunit
VGTVPTDSVWFAVLLVATLLVMTALSYLPALALGPILERLRFGT